jgi:hypothetical protein
VIANLFPEGADAHPGYRAKDRLENALRGIVCRGAMRLRTVQRRIAANWQRLYAQYRSQLPLPDRRSQLVRLPRRVLRSTAVALGAAS